MTINNNNIFGAFTLGEVRSGRLTGEWLNKESVANYGWWGGGYSFPPATFGSTVDRIDFSNDSINASPRGPLSLARRELAATGNSNYGWFGGGTISYLPTINTSSVDRIDFSNDSSTASVRGPLTSIRQSLSATGNSNYGWFGGGFTAISIYHSSVNRIDFSNDFATVSLRGPLSLTRASTGATGNSNYGWFGGGYIPAIVSRVDRIDFSNDSVAASVRGSLSLARGGLAATANSNYGWFGGGSTGLPVVSRVDRIDFSNDSVAASVRGSLSLARGGLAATANSNYGWFGGGGFPAVSRVDRIDFSNDTASASPRSLLSAGRYQLAATSGVLNIRRQKAGNFGWFGGGVPDTTTVDRIDFSNDTGTTNTRGPLSLSRGKAAATGNSNYGWFGGGLAPPSTPSTVSRVDRIDFSNDSTTASVRGPLSLTRASTGATGNSNYGWFGGGYIPAIVSRVDRIDFSNDSVAASPRGSLSSARYVLAATGNSNYGWFGGGQGPGSPFATPVATVDRIDFSNDSATASVRGPLSVARYSLAATGNSNYGWFGGGQISGSQTATVERINFSNDSVSTLPRGPLSLNRRELASTSNSNYGWFGGGIGGSPFALQQTVDRIDFSNDSVTASPRGPLSLARYGLESTSNTPT